MEEDIKILEDLKNKINFNRNESKYENSTYRNALENLIAGYKQLEEENKEIKKEFAINTEIHKRDEIIKDLKETINCLHETDKENYIPKSKVKEKIEELDIQISECEYADDDIEERKQDIEKKDYY